MKKLTAKQELFCKEYLIDLNATQAAIRAGYSNKTAKDIGCQNLAKLNIAECIAKLKADRQEKVDIDALWVLKQAVECFNVNKATDGTEMVNAAAAAKFLEMVGKHTTIRAFDGEPDSITGDKLNITFNVSDPAKEIRVTSGA